MSFLCLALISCPQVHVAPTPHLAAPCAPAPLDCTGVVSPYTGTASATWTDLFDRDRNWTGADGVYSIPLDGDERPCSGHFGRTYFTFSDTFIGLVDAFGQRSSGTVLVNNTGMLLTGGSPVPAQAEFLVHLPPSGPEALVVPDTAPDHWFWPMDGLTHRGELFLFALRLRPDSAGFGFAIDGVSLLRGDATADQPLVAAEQAAVPSFGIPGGQPVTFGRAVLVNTQAAGAPVPDGYVYVYGLREQPFDKQLLISRVLPDQVADPDAYRYWNGSSWGQDPTASAGIASALSSEFSVSPLADGRFLLVYQQLDFLSRDIAVAYAPRPAGPFGDAIPVYTMPEPDFDPDVFTYGAKAHPHLSSPKKLLISYHVNTFDFFDHFANADIYRPRFIELPLP